MTHTERRALFRINEQLLLNYCVVTSDDLNKPIDNFFPESQTIALLAEFQQLDHDAKQLLRTISEQQRQVGEYLSILNRKVELLAQQLLSSDTQASDEDKIQVNISESGIAFNCQQAVAPGSHLALQLTFLPQHIGIQLFAKVIRCDAIDKQPKETQPTGGDNTAELSASPSYRLAVEFHAVDDAQRQLLAKQIMQAQLAAKRRHKAQLESPKT